MYTVIPFSPEHLDTVTLQPHQSWMQPMIEHGYGQTLFEAGPAETVLRHGEVIACYGEVIRWEGMGEAWTIIDAGIGAGMVVGIRAAKRFYDRSGNARLQAYVDAEFAQGCRLMELLGFSVEARLSKYMPDGHDALLFASVCHPENPLTHIELAPGVSMLHKIMRLQDEMSTLPQIDVEIVKYRGQGMIGRAAKLKAGGTYIGEMHRFDHISVILSGNVWALTESGLKQFRGGDVIEAKSGVKRCVFAVENSIWLTLHATDKEDWDSIKAEVVIPHNEVLKLLEVAA